MRFMARVTNHDCTMRPWNIWFENPQIKSIDEANDYVIEWVRHRKKAFNREHWVHVIFVLTEETLCPSQNSRTEIASKQAIGVTLGSFA